MSVSTEQLGHLAQTELAVFRPSGLNDDQRRDLRDGPPFLAIDPSQVKEVDDAIRVQRLRGGSYLFQVAIADGAQLAGADKLIDTAVQKRWNNYPLTGKRRTILPSGTVSELELRGESRALVVAQPYTADFQPQGEVDIFPATVKVTNQTYQTYSQRRLRDTGQDRNLLAHFHRGYRQHHELRYETPAQADTGRHGLSRYGERLVATYMVLANLAVASWAAGHQVPIIYRNFSRDETVWDELEDKACIRGVYDPTAETHDGISHLARQEDAAYTHATSPLRRAIDLVNHLQIGLYLAGREPNYDKSALSIMSRHFNLYPVKTTEPAPSKE